MSENGTDVLEEQDVKAKKKKKTRAEKVVTWHWKGIAIKPKKTIVYWEREIMCELEEGEEDNTVYTDEYPVSSNRPVHEDLTKALKALTAEGLSLGEIEIEGSKSAYTIIGVSIAGDMELMQSRCSLVVGHKVKRTGKVIPIKVGEFVMYGESDFPDTDKAVRKLEALKSECYAYSFEKKYGTKDPNQLPLFVQ